MLAKQNMKLLINITVLFVSVIVTAQSKEMSVNNDNFIWLEEIKSEKVDEWIEKQNYATESSLKSNPDFNEIVKQSELITGDEGALPDLGNYLTNKGYIYKIIQDELNPQGRLVRTKIEEIRGNADWRELVSLDDISKSEKRNWFFSPTFFRFSPDGERVLISLSEGGSDAVSYREFNLKTNEFVNTASFNTPLNRAYVEWLSRDLVLINSSLNGDGVTDSNYPRTIRIWKRGEDLEQAKSIFTAAERDALVSFTALNGFDKPTILISNVHTFSDASFYLIDERNVLIPVELPSFFGIDFAFFGKSLRQKLITVVPEDWTVGSDKTFSSGQLVAIKLNVPDDLGTGTSVGVEVVKLYSPSKHESIDKRQGFTIFDNVIYLNVLRDVVSNLYELTFENDSTWAAKEIAISDNGTITFPYSGFDTNNPGIFRFESLISNPREFLISSGEKPELINDSAQYLNQENFKVEQYFATGKDNSKLPYFVAYKKQKSSQLKSRSVLMYGYGGFGISSTPSSSMPYLGALQPMWLDRGEIFVVANVRGGGEYGPDWHSAAKGVKRQTTYDDFAAITEDLIERGFGEKGKVSFIGGSNGGLSAGVLPIQRPDLFGASISLVPLLDMMRFHKLLAGASWMDEYGNPEEPSQKDAILGYSPYQKVSEGETYPPILFMTSTTDDRVHPGHARKMAAKMQRQGHQAFFYEAREGGHSMAVDKKGKAYNTALQMAFLEATILQR